MILPGDSQNFNCDNSSFEDRFPRDKYPGLYLGADEFAVYKALKAMRRELLELLRDDIVNIALAVVREVLRGHR